MKRKEKDSPRDKYKKIARAKRIQDKKDAKEWYGRG